MTALKNAATEAAKPVWDRRRRFEPRADDFS